MAESDASKELSRLDTDLNTAQLQWETYATGLGSGYTKAYVRHKETLDGILEMRRAGAEAMYFVLSALTAGFAGGLAGGLIAPWFKDAAASTAKAVMKETARGITVEWAKRGWGEMPRTLHKALSNQPPQDMFHPAVKEPLEYYQDMTYEIGLCFAALRYEVNEIKTWADDNQQPVGVGVLIRDGFKAQPLLKDQPTILDMPYKEDVARDAETGMWIAWANVRDIEYWNRRMKYAGFSLSSLRELQELNPIVNRLKRLGWAPFATRLVQHGSSVDNKYTLSTVLDIQGLKLLGSLLGGVFFGRVAAAVTFPDRVLPQMYSLKPVYKR